MYRLRVESQFNAAHKLIGYRGKCSRIHGHTWKVEVFVVGEKLDEIGILVDFNILKERLEEIVEKLDHSFLNDFKEIGNPTSENISKYIFKNLGDLPEGVKLEKVRVWESPSVWCEYYE
ncbi:MAG: 6-carboxytetrahydropterin synthase QueD [Candidatus Bathyarchaeia archaeon]